MIIKKKTGNAVGLLKDRCKNTVYTNNIRCVITMVGLCTDWIYIPIIVNAVTAAAISGNADCHMTVRVGRARGHLLP